MSKIHLLNYGACTGCFGRIAIAISRIKDHEMKEEAYIAMGPKVKPIEEKGRNVLRYFTEAVNHHRDQMKQYIELKDLIHILMPISVLF